MKTSCQSQTGRGGSAVIVVLGLIAILLVYAVGNVRTLDHLGKELRFLEQSHRRAWSEVRANPTADAAQAEQALPAATPTKDKRQAP
jgi:hypothetical protein